MKLTINPHRNEIVEIEQWEITNDEPSCVAIDSDFFSYIIVMDLVPRVETWLLDDEGQLKELVRSTELPS